MDKKIEVGNEAWKDAEEGTDYVVYDFDSQWVDVVDSFEEAKKWVVGIVEHDRVHRRLGDEELHLVSKDAMWVCCTASADRNGEVVGEWPFFMVADEED